MNIAEAINKIKNINESGRGSNKKCYIIDNYALLVGSSVDRDEKAEERISKLKELKEKGVNLACVLEFKSIDGVDYELQEKAQGEELFSYYSMKSSELGQLKYLKRLIDLSEEDISFYEKFLIDWDLLLKSKIAVDPSKPSNFFYEKGKNICFLDLNIDTSSYEERKINYFYEIAAVLRGGGLLYMCNTVKDKAKNVLKIIYQKLGLAVKNLGLDLDKYIKDVDPSGEYGLKNFFDYNDNKSLNK